MLGVKEKKDKHESCRFCEWLRDWENWRMCEGEARYIMANDDFVAVLEKFPRIDGEILIISRKPYNHNDKKHYNDKHYEDVSDIIKFTPDEQVNLCKILGETISLMKQNLKAEKVYLYIFCEHWEEHEIAYEDKKTTEHLHFHLLPRYRGMRHKELVAEKIFNIPTKKPSDSMLQAVKDELLREKTT